MAIKQLTLSALTGGALVLAYAAWSKWRAAPPQLAVEASSPTGPALEAEAIDVALDELWAAEELEPNPHEQLVDFSSEPADDTEAGAVAPEGLGVRWLTQATEAMSPFHHALSLREEAEAALLEEVDQHADEQLDPAPESSQRSADSDFAIDLPVENRG